MFKSCSPYLKMFCEKGINWHFFLTEELLKKVIEEDRIIFLHIGYVSNINIRESSLKLFADRRVQKMLNENFLPIIEDKEDKPESFLLALDLLFLNQDFSYGPMNMFIMPDRKPIIAFSDCDPDNFLKIAGSLLKAKSEKRERLNELSDTLSFTALNSGVVTKVPENKVIDQKLMDNYVDSWFEYMFNNGFIYRIKPFTPNPSGLYTIVDYLSKCGNKKYFNKTEEILDHLQFSALFDVIDGGFFRQAQDYSCNQPLYEKTLEENSRFLMLYAAAYQLFGKESYRTTAIMIFQYIVNELKNESGGFVNSSTILDKVENVDYYSYSINELKLLFPEEYQKVAFALGLNPDKDTLRKLVLVRKKDTYEILSKYHLTQLRHRRAEHRGYYKDSRAISSSNSTAVASLSLASRFLNDIDLYRTATQTFEFITRYNIDKQDGRLYRYTCDSDSYLMGNLSDYSFFIEACLELYNVQQEKEYLSFALKYTNYVIKHFYKLENGMFSKSEKGTKNDTIPFKRESNLDIVRPSANSIMAGNLITIYKITNDVNYLNIAKRQIVNISQNLTSSAAFLSSWAHQVFKLISIT